MLDPDHCYSVLRARDARFDGVFFVGVETTGIYCRPVCPARLPRRSHCRFFERAAAAERAGFRACLRCRPERAPGHAPVDALPSLVRSALARIGAGALDHTSVEALAASLGVTDRHLRRAVEAAVGLTPVELAQSRRLGLAKWLIQDTQLSMTQVAHSAGYRSLRRFNAAIAARHGCAPSQLRKLKAAGAAHDGLCLRLEARPPFAGKALLDFLGDRAIPGVEEVSDGCYRRVVCFDDAVGLLEVELDPLHPGLSARVDAALLGHLPEIISRIRALFDLDARPDLIDAHLARDRRLRARVAREPGLRVPGAFDGWELAVRAILGQRVAVRAATTVGGRLVRRFGERLRLPGPDAEGWRFPAPATLAEASIERLGEIGLPRARAAAIVALATGVRDGAIDLSPGAASHEVVPALQALPGIGPWTARYIAMRALRDPDSFPSDDLVAKRALGVTPALGVTRARDAEAASAAWRPWRAYAVMHLWRSMQP